MSEGIDVEALAQIPVQQRIDEAKADSEKLKSNMENIANELRTPTSKSTIESEAKDRARSYSLDTTVKPDVVPKNPPTPSVSKPR